MSSSVAVSRCFVLIILIIGPRLRLGHVKPDFSRPVQRPRLHFGDELPLGVEHVPGQRPVVKRPHLQRNRVRKGDYRAELHPHDRVV